MKHKGYILFLLLIIVIPINKAYADCKEELKEIISDRLKEIFIKDSLQMISTFEIFGPELLFSEITAFFKGKGYLFYRGNKISFVGIGQFICFYKRH